MLRDGGVAQVVEHLSSKQEALNSNPINAKKKEKEKERNISPMRQKKLNRAIVLSNPGEYH
jgi:hypothetical protein